MIALALRSLRFRKGSFVATFIAMCFGAAMVLACAGLMETGIRNNVAPQRLAQAPVVVTGNASYHLIRGDESVILPERVRLGAGAVDTVQQIPGVQRAVPDVSFPAALVGAGGTVQTDGHDWQTAALAPYSLTSGTAPISSGDVVLDSAIARRAGVSVGRNVQIVVRGEPETFHVSGIAAASKVTTEPPVFFSAAAVRHLAARPDLVDSIGVIPDPGTDVHALHDRIQKELPQASVLVGSDRGLAEFPDALSAKSTLIVMAGVFGGLATTIAVFVVASTLALTVQHRQRELALLRTVGITPRQLRRMVLSEAAVVAILATALAIVPGSVLGRLLFDQLSGHDVVPDVITYYQGRLPMVIGCGAAILAAVVAALIAGRRAGRVRPIEALAEAAEQRRWLGPIRLILALLFLGGGFALLLVTVLVMSGPVAASTAGPSIMLWAIGFALLGPALTKVATVLLYLPVRLFGGLPGRLALMNFRARSVAMAAAVVPVMLATAMATANLYMQTTTEHAQEQAYLKNLRADAVLTSAGGGFRPGLLEQVRAVPGVQAASSFVTSTGAIDGPHDKSQDEDGLPLQGLDAGSAAAVTGIHTVAGSLSDLSGDTIALPERRADRLHLAPGDRVTLRFGDRAERTLRVVALFGTEKGYDTIVLPSALLAAHTTSGAADQIMVRASSRSDVDAVTDRLRKLTSGAPGVQVSDRDALIADNHAGQKINEWINYLLVGMIVAYTAVSIVNTLVAATTRRRREFGLQRLAGSTRSQVLRMLGAEGFLVAVAGIVLGTFVALLTLLPFCAALGGASLPSGPVWIYLTIVGTALGLTMIATLVPAWATLRTRPAEAVAAP